MPDDEYWELYNRKIKESREQEIERIREIFLKSKDPEREQKYSAKEFPFN